MTCSWHISFPNTGHTDTVTQYCFFFFFLKSPCGFKYCYSAHTLGVSDTHRGRQRPADAGHSPAGSRWGIEAAGRSWKRSMQSRPGWSGKSPARRSTDAGTWDKKGGRVARLQTQRHGRNSGGSAAHTGGAKPEETYHKGTWYILYILPFTDFKAGYFWLECKLNPLSSGYKMTTFNVRGNETEKCRAETMEMQMCVLSVVTDGS